MVGDSDGSLEEFSVKSLWLVADDGAEENSFNSCIFLHIEMMTEWTESVF